MLLPVPREDPATDSGQPSVAGGTSIVGRKIENRRKIDREADLRTVHYGDSRIKTTIPTVLGGRSRWNREGRPHR